MNPIEQAQAMIKAYRQKDAEILLDAALKDRPDDPDLHAERGLLFCFTQREFKATEEFLLAEGAHKRDQLGQTLANYFHCRKQIADKYGIHDSEADRLAAQIPVPPQPGVGSKLTACLIVKNEERNLARCLSSIRGICDEIVVVDTGSNDRTVEIARSFDVKLGFFEWVNDFAAARNYSLELATGNWILWIDADEELAVEAQNGVREAIMRPHFGGYFIQIVNFMDPENPANQYVHTPVRLFRNTPQIRFEGRVHEQVLQDFDRHGFVAATLTGAKIYHYGYQAETMREKDKIARTIGMLERETKEHPRDPFQWFNLANAYCVARQFEDAARAARIAIHFLDANAPYGPVTYQILSTSLAAQGRFEEALQVGEDAKLAGFFTIVNQFELAHAYLKLGQYRKALDAALECEKMPWPSDLAGDYAIRTYKGKVLKGQILAGLGQFDEAMALYDEALAIDPNFGMGLFAKANLLQEMGRLEEAADHFWRSAPTPGLGDCRILAAQVWRELGQYERGAKAMGEAWFDGKTRSDLTAAWIQLAELWGDVDYQLEAYAAVAEVHDPSADLLVNWGRALVAAGRVEEAFGCYRRAIEQDPSSANAFFNLGDLLYAVGDYLAAASAYESGLKSNPNCAAAWFTLGNCFAQLNHDEGATIAYRQALQIEPNLIGARHNLALLAAA